MLPIHPVRAAPKLIQEEVQRIVHILRRARIFSPRWARDLELSRQMYREAGIEVNSYEIEQVDIENACITDLLRVDFQISSESISGKVSITCSAMAARSS